MPGAVVAGKGDRAVVAADLIAQLRELWGAWVTASHGSLVSVFLRAVHIVKRSRQANKHWRY